MSTSDNASRVGDLLLQLRKEGATIKSGGERSALTEDALSSVAEGADFDAWITWTKSF